MGSPSFDPTHAVRFDLPRGAVRPSADAERVLLVPAAALLEALRSTPPEAVDRLGQSLGAGIGKRAATRMGKVAEAPLDAFVTQLAGEAALLGVGRWSVERWGRALVVRVEESPVPGALCASIVRGAVEAASGRRVACTLLAEDGSVTRVLVASERGVARVREWMANGSPWADAVARLHGADR